MEKRSLNSEGRDAKESDSLLTTHGVAELKEAFGRLYKRVEEAEAASKEQREKDRQVLNLWAETNLVQTELLHKQTKLIEQLTQELQKNETFWQKFAKSSADLMRDLMGLKQQLMGMPPRASSAELTQIEALTSGEAPASSVLPTHRMKSKEMRELEATLAQMWLECEEMPTSMRLERISRIAQSLEEIRYGKERIQKITFDVPPLDKKTAVKIVSIAVIAVVAALTGLGLFLPRYSDLNEIETHLGWANTKLTRIEKKLETNHGK